VAAPILGGGHQLSTWQCVFVLVLIFLTGLRPTEDSLIALTGAAGDRFVRLSCLRMA